MVPQTPIKIQSSAFFAETDVENDWEMTNKSSQSGHGDMKRVNSSASAGGSPRSSVEKQNAKMHGLDDSASAAPSVAATGSRCGSDVDDTAERKRGKKVLRNRRMANGKDGSGLFEQQTVAQGCLIAGPSSSGLGSPVTVNAKSGRNLQTTGEGEVIDEKTRWGISSLQICGVSPGVFVRMSIFVLLVSFLAAETHARCKLWTNPEDLAAFDIETQPLNPVAWTAYGDVLIELGVSHYDRAEKAYEKAWTLDQRMIPAVVGWSELLVRKSHARQGEIINSKIVTDFDVESLRLAQQLLRDAIEDVLAAPTRKNYAVRFSNS